MSTCKSASSRKGTHLLRPSPHAGIPIRRQLIIEIRTEEMQLLPLCIRSLLDHSAVEIDDRVIEPLLGSQSLHISVVDLISDAAGIEPGIIECSSHLSFFSLQLTHINLQYLFGPCSDPRASSSPLHLSLGGPSADLPHFDRVWSKILAFDIKLTDAFSPSERFLPFSVYGWASTWVQLESYG